MDGYLCEGVEDSKKKKNLITSNKVADRDTKVSFLSPFAGI